MGEGSLLKCHRRESRASTARGCIRNRRLTITCGRSWFSRIVAVKTMLRSKTTLVAACFLPFLLYSGAHEARVQQMHHESAPATRSERLVVRGMGGKALTLSADEFAKLPRKTVVVINGHSKASESYSGVLLSVLLAKVDVPEGEQIKGGLFMTGVIAEGIDGYEVLYSLAEIDPALHTGDVLVADALNGKPLIEEGAFKLVSTEDKRPARWVRNLGAISVLTVTPKAAGVLNSTAQLQ